MEVIEELIKLAKETDAANKRGEDLRLMDDEVALTPSFPLGRAAPIAARCLFASLHSPFGQPASGYLRCASVRSRPRGSALRRPRRERERRQSDGRRQTQADCRRTHHPGEEERDDRLELTGERSRKDSRDGAARPEQIRLSP